MIFLFTLFGMGFAFLLHKKDKAGIMFRIRESYADQETVYISVDGRLSDRDLGHFQDILGKYLDLKMRVFVNLTHLTQVGWEGKRFLHKMRSRVVLVDLPEYLKTEIMNDEENIDTEGEK
jgi:hypothetical protein